MRFWYSVLFVFIFQLLIASAQAQVPSCAGSGDAGNSYESCASGWCERLVCDGSGFKPEYIWSNAGYYNPDLGNDTSTCTADRTGRLRYTGSAVEVCSGSAWVAAGGGGSLTYPQDISSATNMVVFNNGGSTSYLSFKGTRNLLVGEGAGSTNTSGYSNNFIGYRAGRFNTTGYENLAAGTYALAANTTGTRNVALGNNALLSMTAGDRNVAIGDGAMYSSTAGNSNVSIGPSAGQQVSGNYNISIGAGANYYNISGNLNVAIGYYAGYNNTVSSNVYIGGYAGYAATTGTGNVLVGDWTGDGTSFNGSADTFIGHEAGYSTTTGRYNTYVGAFAASAATAGENNVAIGQNAGGGLSTGSHDTVIGVDSGASLGTSDRSILIGFGTDANASYSLNIGNVIYGTTGTSASQSDTVNDNSAFLTVDGSLRVRGTGSETCDASNGGRMRYNSGTKKMQYCNETAWTDM